MNSAEAKNLEAISRAIDQHNANCPFPAAEVRMNPFEIERLGWEEIRGLPLVGDPEIGTGRFRIVCSRELDGEGLEEIEAVGEELRRRARRSDLVPEVEPEAAEPALRLDVEAGEFAGARSGPQWRSGSRRRRR